MNETILVVDDEESIRSTLAAILRDEGFRVVQASDPGGVFDLIDREKPALLLLDVWMPEIDGIELLRRIKETHPALPVVMISGHGNIQAAVAAVRLGAADFLEKPFSVEALLTSLRRVLGLLQQPETRQASQPEPASAVAASTAARDGVVQRTVRRSIVFAGQGLHSGLKTGAILQPAPPDFGIVFSPLGDDSAIRACVENVAATGYNTTLALGGKWIRTVEHLMSALYGLGISNLLVKTDGEIPALDGSAAEFCRQIAAAGVEEQKAWLEPARVRRRVVVGDPGQGGEFISAEPAARLVIDYRLEYAPPIGTQEVHFELSSPEVYAAEIAPARTFGFVHEFRKLSEMGLARGGRLDNVILVDDRKVVNTALRFPDEFARHKVLDLIGDLYLLGRPLLGHIKARKTGHSDNLALVQAIRASL